MKDKNFPAPSYSTLLYIAGPYTQTEQFPSVAHNIHYAWSRAFHYVKLGYGVICPHANTFHMEAAAEYTAFIEMTAEMLRRCDGAVFIKGWEKSNGAQGEYKIARELGIPCLLEE